MPDRSPRVRVSIFARLLTIMILMAVALLVIVGTFFVFFVFPGATAEAATHSSSFRAESLPPRPTTRRPRPWPIASMSRFATKGRAGHGQPTHMSPPFATCAREEPYPGWDMNTISSRQPTAVRIFLSGTTENTCAACMRRCCGCCCSWSWAWCALLTSFSGVFCGRCAFWTMGDTVEHRGPECGRSGGHARRVRRA